MGLNEMEYFEVITDAKTGEQTIRPYTPEEVAQIEADAFGQERASMSCTPAQMRLTLHRAGLLATVQAIADSDPEASIVWEYATVIQRNSPFIDALAGDQFTPEQIDDLFRVASNV
jgi:hypothetical protein